MRKRILPLLTPFLTIAITLAATMSCAALPQADGATAEIVCIQCHGKLPGKYGEPVKLWRGSIHAENGIACNACHGGDPKDAVNAMNPARGFLGAPQEKDIPAFCGRCHVGVLKDYLSSLHGKALGRGGPTCVTCHGNHNVVKASLELINEKSCSRCHSYDRAKEIKAAMAETEKMILAIDARTAGFREQGIDTDRLEKGLFAIRNSFHSLFHTVDTGRVGSEAARIQEELKKLDDRLTGIDEQLRKRKLLGAAAVAVALLAALLFYLCGKTCARPER
jgi:hypothetical protein